MAAIRCTDLALRQLLQIRTCRLGEAGLAAVEGLAFFPQLGRVIPESEDFLELAGVRDLTVSEVVRVHYEPDRQREVICILALLFPGQELTPEKLGLIED